MKEELKLVIPSANWKEQALDFKAELFSNGETVIHGGEMFDQIDSYEEWLDFIEKGRDPATVNEGWAVADTYFIVRASDNYLLGIADLRHELIGILVEMGHTGYHIRPSQRRKGYGLSTLDLIRARAIELGMTELIVSADQGNIASIRTIQKGGGIFLNTFVYKEQNEYCIANRYVIKLIKREVAAGILVRNKRLFATQRGYGDYKGFWEFPGGKREEGETMKDALVRELQEELGITIRDGEYVTTIEYHYPGFYLKMDCFACRKWKGEITLKEHMAGRWLTKEELHDVTWLPADIRFIKDISEGKYEELGM